MNKKSEPLTRAEWKCLSAIDSGARFTSPAVHMGVGSGGDCSEATLRTLESRGLIELAPEIWLPLEMKRSVYRLTAIGRRLLISDKKD